MAAMLPAPSLRRTRTRCPGLSSRLSRIPCGLLVLAALIAVAAGVAAVMVPHAALDDAYITYRYAQNLLEGRGFVFNPGEHVLTTTAAGYALVLTPLGFVFGHDFPLISNLVSAACLLLGGLLIYAIAAARGHRLAGLAAAVLYQMSPLALESFGMETATYMAAILGGFYAFQRGRTLAAGAAFGAAMALRADAALPAAIAFAFYIVQRRRIPWRGAIAPTAVAGPLLIFLWVRFGSPFPVTLAAKAAQRGIGFPTYLGGARTAFNEYTDVSPLFWALLALAALGALTLPRQRWLWPLAAWAGAHVLAYHLLGVTSYRWYYMPLTPAIALCAGLALEYGWRLARPLLRTGEGWRGYAAGAMLCVAAAAPLAAEATWLAHTASGFPDARERYYRTAGEWLRENTAPGTTVGVMEAGIMSYYAERHMVDFLGLTSQDTAHALEHDDIFWPVAHFQPDYLVFTSEFPLWNYPIYSDPWFLQSYILAKRFDLPVGKEQLSRFPGGPKENGPFVIYQRASEKRNPLAAEHAVNAEFDGKLRLRAFGADPASPRPGQFLAISLRWQPVRPLNEKLNVFVHAVNERGVVAAQADVTVNGPRWPGHSEVQHYAFMPIPADTPPGEYRLVVGVSRLSPPQRLALTSGGEGDALDVGMLRLLPAESPPAPETLPLAQRSEYTAAGVTLLGWAALNPARAGSGCRFRLTFQKVGAAPPGLALVVRARDPQGRLVAEGGTPLETSDYPAARWRDGEVLACWLDLLIPADAPATLDLSVHIAHTLASQEYPESPLGELQVEP